MYCLTPPELGDRSLLIRGSMKFLKIKLTHCPKLTHSPKIDTIAPNLTQCHRIQESILKIIILVANFKLMVLRAQIELGVQIFVGSSFRLIFVFCFFILVSVFEDRK